MKEAADSRNNVEVPPPTPKSRAAVPPEGLRGADPFRVSMTVHSGDGASLGSVVIEVFLPDNSVYRSYHFMTFGVGCTRLGSSWIQALSRLSWSSFF